MKNPSIRGVFFCAYLFLSRTSAISISSFTSLSVSGLSHSWLENIGVRFDSLSSWIIMSEYFDFIVIVVIGREEFWKCGRSHFHKSYHQSIPCFLAIFATIRHCLSSLGYNSSQRNHISIASQSWWFERATLESHNLRSSFCLSGLLHDSVTKITSPPLFTSCKNQVTFFKKTGLSLSRFLYAIVFIIQVLLFQWTVGNSGLHTYDWFRISYDYRRCKWTFTLFRCVTRITYWKSA